MRLFSLAVTNRQLSGEYRSRCRSGPIAAPADIDAALRGGRGQVRDPKALLAEPDSGVVLIRNNTGSDLTEEHAIVGIDPPLIIPDDRGNVVFERPVFDGIDPAEGQPFAVLLQPLADGAIGKAIISGGTWVKVEVNNEGDDYADLIDAETDYLLTGGSGTARILWLADDAMDDPDVRWAYVSLGDAKPVIYKARITTGERLKEGTNEAAAILQQFNSGTQLWEDVPAGEVDVWPDPGFRGVAFEDDTVEIYYSISSQRWQAVSGGRVTLLAYADGTVGSLPKGLSGGTWAAFAMDPAGPAITITMCTVPVADGKAFVAVWIPKEDPVSMDPGSWAALGDLNLGCSLKFYDAASNPAFNTDVVTLDLDMTTIAGDGLSVDEPPKMQTERRHQLR